MVLSLCGAGLQVIYDEEVHLFFIHLFAIWLVMGKDLFKSFSHYFLWILSFFNTHLW